MIDAIETTEADALDRLYEDINNQPRRAASLRRREQVRKTPGKLPGMSNARSAGRPLAGEARAELLLESEITERREIESLHTERMTGEAYQPRALPLRVEHLRGVQTGPLAPHEATNALAYLCHLDRETGEDVYRLCKLTRVGGMTADVVAFDSRRTIGRVRLGCLSVVLTV